MSKELSTIQNNPVELNKAFGFEGKPKPSIPLLKVNGSDDEDGTSAPKGTFTYDDGDKILYASEVTIRSFVKAYQYRLYHPTEKDKNDMSIISNTFKAEFRSTSGRLACGKMNKKSYVELGDNVTTQQKYYQDNVKCKLLMFGLVSGEFTDVDTKTKIEVKDALFSWVVSQSGFMSIDQTIKGIEMERRAIPLTPIRLRLKKEKNGSVTYFVPIPEVLNETAKLDIERDTKYLEKVKDFIVNTNKFIDDKYTEALKGKANNDDFAAVGTIVEGKTSKHKKNLLDIDDVVPF